MFISVAAAVPINISLSLPQHSHSNITHVSAMIFNQPEQKTFTLDK
jgi:hypothetical protein